MPCLIVGGVVLELLDSFDELLLLAVLISILDERTYAQEVFHVILEQLAQVVDAEQLVVRLLRFALHTQATHSSTLQLHTFHTSESDCSGAKHSTEHATSVHLSDVRVENEEQR